MIKLDKVSAAITVSIVSVLISLGLVAKCRQISNKINDISAKIEKLESKIVPESQQSSPPTPVLSSGPPPSAPRVPSKLNLNFDFSKEDLRNLIKARKKSNFGKTDLLTKLSNGQFVMNMEMLGQTRLRNAGKGEINKNSKNKPSQDLIKKAANKLNHVPSNLRFQSYWKNLSKRDRLSAPWLREIHEGAKNVRSGSGPKENKDERAQELNSGNNGEKINVAVSDGTNNVYDTLSDAAKKSIQEKVNKMNEPFR